MKLIMLLLMACTLTACTTFSVEYADGTKVSSIGAPLVNRDETFSVTHQWLGADNVLHQVTVDKNTKENTDRQLELMKAAFEAGKLATPVAPVVVPVP